MRTRMLWSFIGLITLLVVTPGVYAQPQQASPKERADQLKKSLSLSDEQADAVLKILKEAEVERKELLGSSGDDRQSQRETMRPLREKTNARIKSLLTKEQKEKFQETRNRRQNAEGGRERKPRK